MRIGKDLVAASATPLVLGILAAGPRHGYAIRKLIAEVSNGRLEWTDGMLYPLLHRLEAAGQIESAWGRADNGRRRKVYSITRLGQAQLARRREEWNAVAETLALVEEGLERLERLGGGPSWHAGWPTAAQLSPRGAV
ncbi:MAG: helix-turn-helix transcriptional regulator [Bifidobacteriaceae bacterium]|jgi:DNA-binding PadR family transcriptional regulator|nr:helix-turn-helix transcriptional regulator [Bifidobacteriaceae bacterium]